MVLQIDGHRNASLPSTTRSSDKDEKWLLASTVFEDGWLRLRWRCEVIESGEHGIDCGLTDRGISKRKGSFDTPLEGRVCTDAADDDVYEKRLINRVDEDIADIGWVFHIALMDGKISFDGVQGNSVLGV